MTDMSLYGAALERAAAAAALTLTPESLANILAYLAHLLAVNERLNLTRITSPDDVAVKHFADSWTLLPWLDRLPDAPRLLDIGTGAGFPGFALKLVRPAIELTVIESIEKKVRFLEDVNARLGLDVHVLLGRAEELAHEKRWRGTFDLVTARAVAQLDVLVELALPFVKKDGLFIAMRGQAEAVPTSLKTLGAVLEATERLVLPGDMARTLYVFRKVAKTPDSLPRSMNKIRKRPL